MKKNRSLSTTTRRWVIFALVQCSAVVLLCAAVLFRAVVDSLFASGRFSSCVMHDLAGLYCPLCGGTRAMVAILQGRFWHSLCCNPLSMYLFVGFLIADVLAAIRIARGAPRIITIPAAYWWGMLALGLIWFVLRNILLVYFGIDYMGDLLPLWAT